MGARTFRVDATAGEARSSIVKVNGIARAGFVESAAAESTSSLADEGKPVLDDRDWTIMDRRLEPLGPLSDNASAGRVDTEEIGLIAPLDTLRPGCGENTGAPLGEGEIDTMNDIAVKEAPDDAGGGANGVDSDGATKGCCASACTTGVGAGAPATLALANGSADANVDELWMKCSASGSLKGDEPARASDDAVGFLGESGNDSESEKLGEEGRLNEEHCELGDAVDAAEGEGDSCTEPGRGCWLQYAPTNIFVKACQQQRHREASLIGSSLKVSGGGRLEGINLGQLFFDN